MKRRDALKNAARLGGAAVLSTSFATLLQACQEQDRLTWEPKFLSTGHAQLVSSLVDALLPATDTPGGLDVKVDILIDLIYAETFDAEAQRKITEEMNQFDDKCVSRFGKVFHQLNPDQKKTILQEEEAHAPKFSPGVWGYPVGEQKPAGFYRSFKSLAVMGYCTSEEIGKTVLKYDPVPGAYQGCIPFAEVGRVWSL